MIFLIAVPPKSFCGLNVDQRLRRLRHETFPYGLRRVPAEGEPAVVTATFTEVDGRTTLTMLTQLPTKEIRDMIIDSGMEGGAQEGMDLLQRIAVSLA